jgi:hypothetical protein
LKRRSLQRLAEALALLGLLGLSLWVFDGARNRVEFFGDEGRYIHRARFFHYLFVERDLTRPEWSDRDGNLNHTAMMFPHYLIGASLWAAGYRVEDLPRMYSWRASPELNRRWGRVPDEPMLMQARLPMILLACGSVLLVYFVGRSLGGVVAGLTGALLAVASPLTQQHLLRVGSDAPVVFLILLTLLLGTLGIRRSGGLSIAWALAVGAALGLAVGSKLTALLSCAAVVGWLILAAARAWQRTELSGGRLARLWAASRGWLAALVVACGVFVLINPHLYPDPLLHTAHLVESRAADMQEMYAYFRAESVRNPLDRPRHVILGSLVHATLFGSRGLPLEAALAALGAAALLYRTLRQWRHRLTAEGFVLLTALCYFGGVSAWLLVAFERYFLPTFLLGALLSGLGLSAILRLVPSLGAVVKTRGSVAQATGPARVARSSASE